MEGGGPRVPRVTKGPKVHKIVEYRAFAMDYHEDVIEKMLIELQCHCCGKTFLSKVFDEHI